MKKIKILACTFIFLLALASMASAYQVYSSGPLNSVSINFFVNNDGPGTINSVQFDLLSPFVIDPPAFSIVAPAGGTATEFDILVNGQYAKFGFNFTSFDVGDTFSFAWDPDIVGNSSFGAVIADLAGTVVHLNTSSGALCGNMRVAGDHLETAFCPPVVPIPGTLMLLGSALIGMVGIGLRRK